MNATIWSVCGIKAVKRGNMNTNTVVAVKRFALYMQKKIA